MTCKEIREKILPKYGLKCGVYEDKNGVSCSECMKLAEQNG